MDFLVPSMIPQDLQLIQDLVGELPQPQRHEVDVKPEVEDDDILSSDGEDGRSEKEVEADILGAPDDDDNIEESPYACFIFNKGNNPYNLFV